MTALAVLHSSDPSMVERVGQAVDQVTNLELVLAEQHAASGHPPAIIFYHYGDGSADDFAALLREAGKCSPQPAVIAITDEFQPTRAIQLLKQGATDCLSRPLDMGRLAMLTDFLTWRARQMPAVASAPPVAAKAAPVASKAQPASVDDPFACWPEEMDAIADQVRTLAPLMTTVLLTGETGTGKTHLARMLHQESPRREKPLVIVNCGTLTASLAESELFGHVQSAFTGADQERPGKFAAAADGTLLLDDIDALSLDMQAKLLQVVDERCYQQVGSDKVLPMRARLVVATNRCLRTEVTEGRFRHDLLYRINVVNVHLPMLRERREMVGPLVDCWVQHFSQRCGRPTAAIDDSVLDALHSYAWPGNLRELRNVVERAVALAEGGVVRLANLPPEVTGGAPPAARQPAPSSDLVASRNDAERQAISRALSKWGNNRSKAAADLGISRPTLYKKLRKYGLLPWTDNAT